ncbi:thiamine phosphate synthase [Mucilaginibacter sp. cycad4]|uniref:thiamine phosphate synthase n=1 Tax=Mucilaginibacter sp. cycad4 TaxID=3342096 RepID=UPI002AAAFBD0|nr:thiamine phosphate synthase [Mucilaginibacter gossypii]WPV02037.1 thiamine phosphate synthase [Mucilaginibacter gossypii]
MELVVISDPGTVANEAQIINRLFDAGLRRFHLRKPDWDIGRCTELLAQVNQSHHHAIASHQHHQLAKTFGMKYLHYTEKGRTKADKLKLSSQAHNDYTLSTSIHQLSDLSSLTVFDYVFYSPVFDSISKPGYHGTLPGGFCLDKNIPGPKVIALGGINESNLHQVNDMNFDGAAVLGAIWNHPQQAVSNFVKIKKATELFNS